MHALSRRAHINHSHARRRRRRRRRSVVVAVVVLVVAPRLPLPIVRRTARAITESSVSSAVGIIRGGVPRARSRRRLERRTGAVHRRQGIAGALRPAAYAARRLAPTRDLLSQPLRDA